MGDILRQLGQLLVQTIPTVIFVFALMIILERLFFAPLGRVMKQREEATSGALARAREQSETAAAKAHEYEASFQAARQEVYRIREANRRAWLTERDERLNRARKQSEIMVKGAQAELASEIEAAKRDLLANSKALAETITESVLASTKATVWEGSTAD
jgi:F-type H+-transporting ATPase subunit b